MFQNNHLKNKVTRNEKNAIEFPKELGNHKGRLEKRSERKNEILEASAIEYLESQLICIPKPIILSNQFLFGCQTPNISAPRPSCRKRKALQSLKS